jgi:hypothetical protein
MARDGDGLHLVGAIWHFRYRSPDGRWKETSTGKRKITEAKAERTKFLRAFADGLLPNDQARWTLEQALDEWFVCRQSTKQPTTLPPERTSIRRLKAILGAKRRLESITALDIRRYQAERRKTVGPKTVNNELLVLIGVLKQAKLWKRLEEDYQPLPIPKAGAGQSTRPRRGAASDRNRQEAPCVGRGPLRHVVGVQFRLPVMGDQVAEIERSDDGLRSARVADPAPEYEDRCRRSGRGVE